MKSTSQKEYIKCTEAILSQGLQNAMNKPLKVKSQCVCGFLYPVYPGKYSKCPLCNTEHKNSLEKE